MSYTAYGITFDATGDGRTSVERCGKTLTLSMSPAEFLRRLTRWKGDGAFVQDAFSNCSADEREFLMTGITPDEWDAMFGDEEA